MSSKGVEYSRHCEGCHNPIALVTGTITKGVEQKRSSDEDGVTCAVCHSIRQGDTRGTGSYLLSQPAVLVDEAGKPIYEKVSDGEILAHLDRHSKPVMNDFIKTPEFCASCHKAALPRTLNDYKWQRALFVFDEWQMSSFSKRSPLPFYTKDTVSNCQTCHMPRAPLTLRDFGAKDGTLASHRWVGANTIIPAYYKYDEQLARTKAFLSNAVFNVDLFAIEKHGTPGLSIGTTPGRRDIGGEHALGHTLQSCQRPRPYLIGPMKSVFERWKAKICPGANQSMKMVMSSPSSGNAFEVYRPHKIRSSRPVVPELGSLRAQAIDGWINAPYLTEAASEIWATYG